MEQMFISENIKGKPTDLEFPVNYPSLDTAKAAWQQAGGWLKNPALWHQLAGWATAAFRLYDPEGKTSSLLAREGDYIRVDIPGPGPASGDGFDWVRIEAMQEYIDPEGTGEWIGIRLRPCKAPNSGSDEIAHFFRDDATSTFLIERMGNTVTVRYYGRNELPNTSTEKITDRVRNALVSSGAIAGLSELQWTALAKGFLSDMHQ